MVGDTGCCGYNFKEKGPNLFGLLTFSMPMLVLGSMAFVVLLAPSQFLSDLRKIKRQVLVIIKANMHLIHTLAFYPKFRCKIAGQMFSFSPRLSGIMYRYFNFILLSLVWAGFIVSISLFIS